MRKTIVCLLLSSACLAPASADSPAANNPDWVNKGSGVFSGPTGAAVIYGVGVAQGIRNRLLAVAAADDRARAECSKTLAASQFSGASRETQLKALRSAVIVDHWKDPGDGTMFSLCFLKPEGDLLGLLNASPPQAVVKPVESAPQPAAQAPVAAPLDEVRLQRMIDSAVKNAAQKQEPAPQPSITSEADTPKYKRPEDPEKYAVVVGVEKYPRLPEAKFSERDAQAMREHLVAMGYPLRHIMYLTGQDATKTGMVKNLETWLPRNVNQKSTVFFYYSGHGAPDPNTGLAYLLPMDGDPEYLEDTAYPVKRLYEKLNALKARQVIVALDSCFSGAGGRSVLAPGTRPLVTKVDMGSVGAGKVVALSASQSNQISGIAEDQGHGLFTYYLLSGLNGAAQDAAGAVTIRSLYDYLLPKVQDNASRRNRDQTPQLAPAGPDAGKQIRLR